MAGKNRGKLGIGHPDMSRFVKKLGRLPRSRSRPDFCRDIIPLEISRPYLVNIESDSSKFTSFPNTMLYLPYTFVISFPLPTNQPTYLPTYQYHNQSDDRHSNSTLSTTILIAFHFSLEKTIYFVTIIWFYNSCTFRPAQYY